MKAIQAHLSNSGCCETSSIQFSQIWINAETKSQPISSTCWAKLCVNSLWTKGNIRKRACCTEKVFLFKIFDLKNVLVGSMNEVGYQIMAQKSFYPVGAFNLGLTRVTQISLCDICWQWNWVWNHVYSSGPFYHHIEWDFLNLSHVTVSRNLNLSRYNSKIHTCFIKNWFYLVYFPVYEQ